MKGKDIISLFSENAIMLDKIIVNIKRKKIDLNNEILQERPYKIIDLSSSQPDAMADVFVLDALSREVSKWENRGYNTDGTDEFKAAAAEYLAEVFDFNKVAPDKELMVISGARRALALLTSIFICPDDIALITSPCVSYVGDVVKLCGGKPHYLPLEHKNKFLPDLDNIPQKILKSAKILYLNYPNNPTGAVASKEFFRKVVKFAKENNIVVIHDASYSPLVFSGEDKISFMSVPGAKSVGVEIHDLGKSFNMEGWGAGFLVGNNVIIKAAKNAAYRLGDSYFKAIQAAAIYALKHPKIAMKTAEKYSMRLKLMTDALIELGFDVVMPKASYYLYVKIPKGTKDGLVFKNSKDFSLWLLNEKGIKTNSWNDVGNYTGYTATFSALGYREEEQLMKEFVSRFNDIEFVF